MDEALNHAPGSESMRDAEGLLPVELAALHQQKDVLAALLKRDVRGSFATFKDFLKDFPKDFTTVLDLSKRTPPLGPRNAELLSGLLLVHGEGCHKLNLSGQNLQASGSKALAKALKSGMAELKNCNLLRNNLDIESAMMLAKIGTEKGILLSGMERDETEADFSDQSLQTADAILIASDLQFVAVLTNLDLSDNYNIGDDGAKAIADALKVSPVLTSLELRSNSIGDDGAKAIAEALKVNPVLTELNLWNNSIGPEGAKAIAEALKVNAVLTKLNVGYNLLDEQAALGIVRAARRQDKITFLGLGRCGIGPIGAKEIADFIQFTAVLTKLDLAINSIGDDGAKAIAEALKVSPVLTSLELRSNSIGDDGAKAIAEALKVNPVLKNCNLLRNNLNIESATMLAKIGTEKGIMLSGGSGPNGDQNLQPADGILIGSDLQFMAVLTSLDFTRLKQLKQSAFSSGISDDGAKAIAEALKVNPVLTKLNLMYNKLGEAGRKAVRDAVKDRSGFVLKL